MTAITVFGALGPQNVTVQMDVTEVAPGVYVPRVETVAPATDAFGSGTRQYNVTAGIRPAVAAVSAAHALPTLGTSREIYIHPNIRTFFRTGTSGQTAAVAAGHHVVEAGEKFHFRVPADHTHIAVIGDGGTGFAAVVPVA